MVIAVLILAFKRGSVAALGIRRAILNAQLAMALAPPHDGALGSPYFRDGLP
jgi:hypothetical protein